MRLRLGFLLGFALGYVLGARAGRARYDQIVGSVRKMTGGSATDDFGSGYAGDGASVTGTATYSSSR